MGKNEKLRRALLAEFGHLYRHHYSKRSQCFYCGDLGGYLDHVPPISWLDTVMLEHWRRMKVPMVTINCCSQCNHALSNKPLFVVEERLKMLEKRMTDKYERGMAMWEPHEIAEMSPMFQKMIRARKKSMALLHERIRHVQWRQLHIETHPLYE